MFRSGRLQEEQRLVAKTCSFFWRILLSPCPNFAELESSKEAKSYHENPCNRITCKKTTAAAPPTPGESGCHPKKSKQKTPAKGKSQGGRLIERAFLTKKGHARSGFLEITGELRYGHWPCKVVALNVVEAGINAESCLFFVFDAFDEHVHALLFEDLDHAGYQLS